MVESYRELRARLEPRAQQVDVVARLCPRTADRTPLAASVPAAVRMFGLFQRLVLVRSALLMAAPYLAGPPQLWLTLAFGLTGDPPVDTLSGNLREALERALDPDGLRIGSGEADLRLANLLPADGQVGAYDDARSYLYALLELRRSAWLLAPGFEMPTAQQLRYTGQTRQGNRSDKVWVSFPLGWVALREWGATGQAKAHQYFVYASGPARLVAEGRVRDDKHRKGYLPDVEVVPALFTDLVSRLVAGALSVVPGRPIDIIGNWSALVRCALSLRDAIQGQYGPAGG